MPVIVPENVISGGHLAAALAYAALGLPVFPCDPRTKAPLTPHGFKDASTDAAQIRKWWERNCDAMIGIATGRKSGFVAIDVDTAESHDADGHAALRRLFDEYGPFPSTVQASTATGGSHFLFAWDEGRPVRNRRGLLPRGLDVRGEGGYIVVPPSRRSDGRCYQWIVPLDHIAPAPMPGWLFDILTSAPAGKSAEPRAARLLPPASVAPDQATDGAAQAAAQFDRYGAAALRRETDSVVRAAPGTRNDTLNRAAFNLGTLVGAGRLSADHVREALMRAAEACGLLPEDAMAVQGTIESGLNAGISKPRQAPKLVVHQGGATAGSETTSSAVEDNARSPIELTHDGVALAFADACGDQLRYCHNARAWYQWVGTHWQRDERRHTFHLIRLLCREASDDVDPEDRGEVRKRAFAGGVESFATADPVFATLATAWDVDPWLLGTPDGTVDLRTGILRAADPADMITRVTSVAPSQDTVCPVFKNFLKQVTQGDSEYERFIQQWGGYCLTGVTNEQAFCFAYGPGGNGKGTLIDVLTGILGPYATTAAMETFVVSRSDRHSTELAMLNGARLVSASETEQGRVLAESRIKLMTGGDLITARFMRKDNFTFRPQFKITIIGNFRPRLANVDEAMTRRLNLLPFEFTASPRDPLLGEKLKAEWPAILRWLIEGCLDWQAHGLVRPARVQVASEDFLAEQDSVAEWLEARCTVDQGNPNRKETTAALYKNFQAFCREEGEPPGTKRTLAEALAKRGFTKSNTVPAPGGRRVRGFLGIELPVQRSHHEPEDY